MLTLKGCFTKNTMSLFFFFFPIGNRIQFWSARVKRVGVSGSIHDMINRYSLPDSIGCNKKHSEPDTRTTASDITRCVIQKHHVNESSHWHHGYHRGRQSHSSVNVQGSIQMHHVLCKILQCVQITNPSHR